MNIEQVVQPDAAQQMDRKLGRNATPTPINRSVAIDIHRGKAMRNTSKTVPLTG
jgi:hypothetical protein